MTCQNEDCAVCIVGMGASWEVVKSQFSDVECICKIPDKALRLKELEVVCFSSRWMVLPSSSGYASSSLIKEFVRQFLSSLSFDLRRKIWYLSSSGYFKG